MGFTPLEGLVMGTRSGDIDPSIIFYLQREKSLSSREIEETINRKSGLLGLGGSSNMRDILSQKEKNRDARLAYEKFIYRVIKYIGSYAMILGEIDAVTFSGGIGENSSAVRADIIKGLKLLDITLDESKNLENKTLISSKESKIATLVIKTDEEIVIAREAVRVK
jgi:acetate kinase